MCYQIIELYSACRCPYYRHPIDRCASYGRPGHKVEQRTIDVGYACSNHASSDPILHDQNCSREDDITDHDDETSVFTEGSSETTFSVADGGRARSADELFLCDLINESEVQYLLPQLVRHSFNTKTSEIICFDLLQWYASDLRQAGTSPLETKAAKLVEASCRRLARRITNIFTAEGRSGLVTETKEEGDDGDEELDDDEEEIDEKGELVAHYYSLYDFFFEGQPIKALKNTMKVAVETLDPYERRRGPVEEYANSIYHSYQQSRFGTSKSFSNSSAKHGAEQIEWTCGCGVTISDDYVELRPGALGDLRVFLANYGPAVSPAQIQRQNASSTSTREIEMSPGSRVRLTMYNGINWWQSISGSPKEQEHSDSSVPSCRVSRLPGSSQLRHRFLLACVPFMKWGLKLQQPDVCGVFSDRDFFKLLKETYTRSRRSDPSKWLRTVSELKFSRFEVFRNDIVDIRASPSMPSSEARKDYDYELPDVDPPIGPNLAMHFLENPDHADSLPILFKRIPVKRNERLVPCPDKGVADGWGVQFEESVSGFAVFLCAFVGFILCLVTSIVWTVVRGDVQGGFGIGAFILAFFLFCSTKIHLLAPGSRAAS